MTLAGTNGPVSSVFLVSPSRIRGRPAIPGSGRGLEWSQLPDLASRTEPFQPVFPRDVIVSLSSCNERLEINATIADPYGDSSDHFHFADPNEGYSTNAFPAQVAVERHHGGANYLFVDGHVQALRWRPTVANRLRENGSRFIKPTGHELTNSP